MGVGRKSAGRSRGGRHCWVRVALGVVAPPLLPPVLLLWSVCIVAPPAMLKPVELLKMLLLAVRMVAPLTAALSATALFAIVVWSTLAVVLDAAATTALPPLAEMIDSLTLANTFVLLRFSASDTEPVIVTFFSEATLKPPALESRTPNSLSLITVSSTYRKIVADELEEVQMPAAMTLPRKLRMLQFSICTSLAWTMVTP